MAQSYTPKGSAWVSADPSTNHLEAIPSEQDENIMLLRSTYAPNVVLPVPRTQLTNFCSGVNGGQFARIGLHG